MDARRWSRSRPLIHATVLLLTQPLCGCITFTEWKPFEYAWQAAQDAQVVSEDLVGAWTGPWRNESSGKEGYVMLVINKSKLSGYHGWAKLYLDHPFIEGAHTTRDTAPWVLEFLIHAERQPDGTFEVGGHAEQASLFSRHEIVCRGTADASEIVGTFRRGNESGRLRLRRITPCPEHYFIHIPAIGQLQYSPRELREQIAAAAEMPLDEAHRTNLPTGDRRDQILPTGFKQ